MHKLESPKHRQGKEGAKGFEPPLPHNTDLSLIIIAAIAYIGNVSTAI